MMMYFLQLMQALQSILKRKMPAVKILRDYMHFLISRTSFGENQFYSKENLFDSHIKEVFLMLIILLSYRHTFLL